MTASWRSTLRTWFIAGLLVWIPLGATALVIRFLLDLLDNFLLFLPKSYRPDALLGFHIPGFGALLGLAIVLGTGAFAANFLGSRVVGWGEALLARIPLVRTVYSGMKKLAETLFSSSGASFRQVLLIEYPRKGIWSVAFQTGRPIGEVQDKTSEEVVTVFVPTTPNPTSGFVILVPKKDVIPLRMTIEEGMRLIISLGVVTPETASKQAATTATSIPVP